MTNKDEVIKAFEIIRHWCEKGCEDCPLALACEHYFDYGTMYGFSDTAMRLLKK